MFEVQKLRASLTTPQQHALLDQLEGELFYHKYKQRPSLGTIGKSISHPLGEISYNVSGSLKLVQFMEGIERQIETL